MGVAHQVDDLLHRASSGSPGCTLSVVVLDDTGRTLVAVEPDARHYAASTMKLPLLLAAYRRVARGEIDLDTPVEVPARFDSAVGGTYAIDRDDDSDPEPWAKIGGAATLRWLCRRMVIRSSNLATNVVLAHVGLPAVAEALDACGATGELVVVRGIGDFAAQQEGRGNEITAAGLARMLLALHQETAADPEVCAEVLDVLAANEIGTDLRAGLPVGTWVAHKNGWVDGVVHDAGLVRPSDGDPFVIVVATTTGWDNETAHRLVADVARTVWTNRDRRSAALAFRP